MRRRISALLLSAVIAVSTFASGGIKEVSAAETPEIYEYQEVSVKNPISNSWHVSTAATGDGGPEWAFDNNAETHWHTNYQADVTDAAGNVINKKVEGVAGIFGTVAKVPDTFAEIGETRVWIGGEFGESIDLAKVEYTGRINKNANWPGQYALYTANAENGQIPSDAEFKLAATGTNNGYSTFTIRLENPVKATHFKIVTFSVIGGNNNMSASEIDFFEAEKIELTAGLGGSIVDVDTQYTQDRFSEVYKLGKTAETLTAWKNDKALSELALCAAAASYKNVTVTASDLTDGMGHIISKDHVTTTFIKSTKAYNGKFLGYGDPNRELPEDNGSNRSESSDILYQTTPIDMEMNTIQPVWVEFAIPEDAEAGTYKGTLNVTAEGLLQPLTFRYTLNVQDAVLPDASSFTESFDIMQWQYPYSSAEYYDVTPFSEEHLDILRSNMEIYKEIGGNAITATFTEEAWSGQTYSKNTVHYPSMVKWTKTAEGFTYDYTDLDQWIGLCKEIELGDKIVLYGIAPWHGAFTYWENGQLKYENYTAGNDRYVAVWTDFLTNLAKHLKEKGWFENAYIGIDERGLSASAFDVAEKAGFKTAADIDNITKHWEIAQRVTDLNVGDTAAQNNAAKFAELLNIREEKGYKTTLYSCTEHQPGQFSLSAPVESYWAVIHAGKMDADGFNRWAFDAWVEDPLNDATHNAFEPGDCFVIYPDEKDAENPAAKYSVRLARMAEGIRDVNKLKVIAEEMPSLSDEVKAVFAKIQYQLKTNRNSYMSSDDVTALASETAAFKKALNKLTEQYIRLKNGGEEFTILNKLTKYTLPENYLSNVEGAASTEEGTLVGTSRQYLGQPDMIRTKTGRLITVFPQGHGHGPLVMKYSEDNGDSWYEVDTPGSWDDSQETPTLYTLNMADGHERLILICACPGRWGNYTTGWDYAYSDDNGDTWSEFEKYWSKFSNGSKNEVIVGMASLVQLKDEEGNDIQKWMAVYHNYDYVNYKTYLTFDKEGNAQWSEPKAYLSDYREIESSHQICEVGMFRSPDGNRIVALARNQTHAGPATMFWSDDEGETWTEPIELPGSLAGERHKALYDPVTGKLVIAFREIDYDRNKNGVWEGGSDWTAGEWVAWVGTYDDLMNLRQGEYMLVLDEDFSNNYYSGDTGYTGMVVLEDGTFVMDSYGHWDQAYSSTYKENGSYNVKTDLCWIRQAKFNLYDLEVELGIRTEVENVDKDALQKAIDNAEKLTPADYVDFTAVEEALRDAQSVLANDDAKQNTVNAATEKLNKAVEALEVVEVNKVVRVAGADRNATSLKVADQLKAVLGVEKFDTVIVATGRNYADALTGSYLAKVKNAPILLTNGKKAVNDAMLAYIKENASENATIYILGKESAVSVDTETLLNRSFENVTRLGGGNRLETNIEILKEAGLEGQTDILIATSDSFADSLSAAATGKPILLVNSKKVLNADQKAILAQFKDGNIYVLGGVSAVYESAIKEVAAAAGKKAADVEAKRLAGGDRFATSVMIAETFFTGAAKAVVACGSGDNYPDGLCGGSLAAAMNAPLILTKDKDTQAAAYAAKTGIKSGYVLGGTNGLVSDDSAKVIFTATEILSEENRVK